MAHHAGPVGNAPNLGACAFEDLSSVTLYKLLTSLTASSFAIRPTRLSWTTLLSKVAKLYLKATSDHPASVSKDSQSLALFGQNTCAYRLMKKCLIIPFGKVLASG